MKSGRQTMISNPSVAYPAVYLAHRGAHDGVVTALLAGSGASWAAVRPPLPIIERQIQLTGHALSKHWAFGGSDDHEQEGLVAMPDQDTGSAIQAFRVNIQPHENEADSAIIVVQREEVTSSPNAAQAEPKPESSVPPWNMVEATTGIWGLAGCCRYLYEISARDEIRVHMMEGPFPLIYGVDRKEMEAPTFSMFLRNILPEDRPFPEAIRNMLITNGSWSGAYRVRGKDGYVRNMRHFAVYHTHQESAFVSGLILNESAVVAARQEASAFKLSVENSREGFAITDSKGRYSFVNQEHARLFGYENAGELLGREWRILYQPAEIQFIQKRISIDVEEAGFWRGHVTALRKDGSTFQQDLTLSMLPSRGLLCICRDRTEELEMNARLEESETMLRTDRKSVV